MVITSPRRSADGAAVRTGAASTRTAAGSLWGTGPYNVDLSDATGTLDNPIRLLTPILATQHHRMFLSRLAPPTAACGCVPLFNL